MARAGVVTDVDVKSNSSYYVRKQTYADALLREKRRKEYEESQEKTRRYREEEDRKKQEEILKRQKEREEEKKKENLALCILLEEEHRNEPRDGIPRIYRFNGVMNGCYTGGMAMAIATSKAEAISFILQEYDEFMSLQAARNNMLADSAKGDQFSKLLLSEIFRDTESRTGSCTGTWQVDREKLLEELTKTLVKIHPIRVGFACFKGGAD